MVAQLCQYRKTIKLNCAFELYVELKNFKAKNNYNEYVILGENIHTFKIMIMH